MTSVSTVLHRDSWIPYNDTFYHSRLVLTYPKNVIFTMQLLSKVQSLPVYNQFPSAERFDASLFQNVDWQQVIIVFDQEHRVVLAPEPVLKLIQLDRRLNYKEASHVLFGPFQPMIPFQWMWITSLLICWVLMIFFSSQVPRKGYQVVLPSKAPTVSNNHHT